MEAAFYEWRSLGTGGVGVGDDFAGCVVSAESASGTGEMGLWGAGVITTGSGDVSKSGLLVGVSLLRKAVRTF